ncbi:MAG TPA: methyltransferase domain-containing protein [Solirubrobacteraceae bacterium]|nr:methyltransferase domain-containing protein [Solirubrobacteraceae bacterium]
MKPKPREAISDARVAATADPRGVPLDRLRCPETGELLMSDGSSLATRDGSRRYPVIGDVPILLVPGRTLFGGVLQGAPESTVGRLRVSLRHRLTASPVSARNANALVDLLRTGWSPGDPPRTVLIVGGGNLGFGLQPLTEAPWIELIETDVYIGPRTAVVCDGHDLPFAESSIDAVVCQAVLEHVADPVRVVAEIHRVLTPGGLIYSEIPFMQQVHEGPFDFTRWTLNGHRRLLRDFDEIDAGAVGGPGEALTWSLRYFGLAFAGDAAWLRQVVTVGALGFGLVLRALDKLLRSRPAAVDAASGTYLLGRRRAIPRSDAEIVAGYVGAIRSPER